MKIIVLILAVFTLLVSAGLITILFLLPETSILNNLSDLGRQNVIISDVGFLLAVLLSGLYVGITVLLSMFIQTSNKLKMFAFGGALLAVIITFANMIMIVFSKNEQTSNIMWLDILVLTFAMIFLLTRYSKLERE